MKRFFGTSDSFAPLAARVFLGAVFLPHGLQKTLGLFGGHGFSGTMDFMTGMVGLPYIVALLVIAGESLGALGLITGFLTRFSAFGIGLIMLGAIFIHYDNGFFMNWSGDAAGEGFEYHLLAIGLSISLIITGGGRWSADGVIAGMIGGNGNTEFSGD